MQTEGTTRARSTALTESEKEIPSYETFVLSVSQLDERTKNAMAVLYLANYDGSSTDMFLADLREKDEVILLYSSKELTGFTTLRIFERTWQGQPIRLIYSGDTIVSPAHWGQQDLAFAWIARIGKIKQQAPTRPLYWFLLVKGHRTYKYLSVFGKSFFPHWSHDRSDLRPLADQLAAEKFGEAYNPATGIVEFSSSRGHLKPGIANASPEEMTKDATRFFLARNPSYRQGHELVCICELELHNMKPLTARIFLRAFDEVLCT
jgi:hypothetical protein